MGKVEQLRYPPEIVRGRAFGSEFSDVILARLVSMTKLQLVSLGVALLGVVYHCVERSRVVCLLSSAPAAAAPALLDAYILGRAFPSVLEFRVSCAHDRNLRSEFRNYSRMKACTLSSCGIALG